MSATHTIAIIGAMPQEIELLKQSLEGAAEMKFGRFSVHHGMLAGKRVVLAQSGIGKEQGIWIGITNVFAGQNHQAPRDKISRLAAN